MITVRDLRFGYPGAPFELRVGHLRIDGGETVAIRGPSGSGKTTLVNLLAGLLSPHAGSIEVAGHDLARLAPEDRQDLRALRLGLVFQEFDLIEYLDLVDNVLLPYRISPVLHLDREARGRAVELLREVGLQDKLRRSPARLSQGERQRVAIARALVTGPAVVLGDEPTTNLDVDNRDQVSEILFRYAARTGAPLVVVSHDPEMVARFSRALDVRELA